VANGNRLNFALGNTVDGVDITKTAAYGSMFANTTEDVK
jgi:hypothetical protein